MTVLEFLLRMMVYIQPALPMLIIAAVITAVVFVVLAVLVKQLWVDQRRFAWLGIFYDMRTRHCIQLACYWMKFLLTVLLLVFFQKMTMLSYLLLILPGLTGIVLCGNAKKAGGGLLWLAAQVAALTATNLVCGFMLDFGGTAALAVVYVCMSLFTALLGGYLFLSELNDISEGRSAIVDEG